MICNHVTTHTLILHCLQFIFTLLCLQPLAHVLFTVQLCFCSATSWCVVGGTAKKLLSSKMLCMFPHCDATCTIVTLFKLFRMVFRLSCTESHASFTAESRWSRCFIAPCFIKFCRVAVTCLSDFTPLSRRTYGNNHLIYFYVLDCWRYHHRFRFAVVLLSASLHSKHTITVAACSRCKFIISY